MQGYNRMSAEEINQLTQMQQYQQSNIQRLLQN